MAKISKKLWRIAKHQELAKKFSEASHRHYFGPWEYSANCWKVWIRWCKCGHNESSKTVPTVGKVIFSEHD